MDNPDDIPRRENDYNLTGWKLWFQQNIYDLGMCFDKREKVPWDVHICQTCCVEPLFFLAGCLCPQLFACMHREFLLWDKMEEEYSCCQGKYGKCWCPNLMQCAPHCALCLEASFCTGCSIGGNRELLKYKEPLDDRCCEKVVLLVSSILSFCGCFSAIISCWTNGCLNSQAEHEIKERTGKPTVQPYSMWQNDNFLCDCSDCEPCCGEPCNPVEGAYCFLCFMCCPLCTQSKLFASSLDEDWACINHVLPYFLAWLLSATQIPFVSQLACMALRGAQRHNARVRDETGDPRHCFGDMLIGACCLTSPCGLCQELRTYPKESWDWLGEMQKGKMPNFMNAGDINFIRRGEHTPDGPSTLEKKTAEKKRAKEAEKAKEKSSEEKSE